ncbi:Disintegrin and metalloproteinase domain-containing protein 28 [Merluccius polli]|uniref:Disintegrin and metalloproteinase domain-containing protein 28 n=1 Tax=Merluccius polli TaxID=89951 RepID=A0AA47MGV1_MERPO|nr:Disintegrin and metalloproteinase domain-containing protein 28 [Merluccius polli]
MDAAPPLLPLLVLVLLLVLRLAAVSVSAELDGTEKYEVVRPIRLHTLNKRDTAYSRPDTLKYAMTVEGKDIQMHLEKNRELLSNDYSETYYRDDGSPVTTLPTDIDHCYYHGQIVNDSQSMVSISTCDGLRGYFRTSAQRYVIEPLVVGEDEGDHAVTTLGDPQGPKEGSKPMVCGVTNTSWGTDFEPPTGRSRSRAAGPSLFQKQKYLELFLVADNRLYLKLKRNQQALRSRIFEVVNYVNMVYKPMNTFIALVGLEVWSNQDLIRVTSPAGALLEAFKQWRNSELVKKKKHDNAHLISGIDFDGATVGLAFVGTLCSGHSVGVVQDHSDRSIAIGATLAHEMGHNLGMNHDDSSACTCTGDSCIMAGALSWDVPKTFSSCSTSNYEQYLNSRTPGCLLNKPEYQTLVAPALCGNGFLENGEDCDCGLLQDCTNPCCNATTCRLTTGSDCAFGECCKGCKIQPHTTECRHKQDECDLPEYCDGTSNVCPRNMFAVNGLPCDAGHGYCYNGQCPQKADQCVKMYGPSATVARQYCYNQNTRGTYYAFCKRPPSGKVIPCQSQDVMCGKLFCHGGKSDPNYGRMVSFSDCKAAFFEDPNSDYGQVDTGTMCAEGKVCSENECVDLQTAYRATNCSAKCPGHGVCNHLAECQCQPGWMAPTCDSKDQSFTKLSSGTTWNIPSTLSRGKGHLCVPS